MGGLRTVGTVDTGSQPFVQGRRTGLLVMGIQRTAAELMVVPLTVDVPVLVPRSLWTTAVLFAVVVVQVIWCGSSKT